MKRIILAPVVAFALPAFGLAQSAVPVTVDNFIHAESDTYFAQSIKHGNFGTIRHTRELVPLDQQTTIRNNRDTLYSGGVGR
jgi:hypothetical protein